MMLMLMSMSMMIMMMVVSMERFEGPSLSQNDKMGGEPTTAVAGYLNLPKGGSVPETSEVRIREGGSYGTDLSMPNLQKGDWRQSRLVLPGVWGRVLHRRLSNSEGGRSLAFHGPL